MPWTIFILETIRCDHVQFVCQTEKVGGWKPCLGELHRSEIPGDVEQHPMQHFPDSKSTKFLPWSLGRTSGFFPGCWGNLLLGEADQGISAIQGNEIAADLQERKKVFFSFFSLKERLRSFMKQRSLWPLFALFKISHKCCAFRWFW